MQHQNNPNLTGLMLAAWHLQPLTISLTYRKLFYHVDIYLHV
jgi:hypothetical protein